MMIDHSVQPAAAVRCEKRVCRSCDGTGYAERQRAGSEISDTVPCPICGTRGTVEVIVEVLDHA